MLTPPHGIPCGVPGGPGGPPATQGPPVLPEAWAAVRQGGRHHPAPVSGLRYDTELVCVRVIGYVHEHASVILLRIKFQVSG